MNTQPNVPVLRPLAPRETPESSRTTGCTFQPMVLPIPSFVAQQATFMSSSTSNVTNILPKAQQPIGSGSEVPAYQTTSSLDQSYAEQTASNKQLLRAGKWIPEEEEYAQLLISLFEGGLVTDCENGATLRSYLSQKLQCAPMRISKKFAGKGIGKMIYACKYTVGSSKQLQLQLQSTELKDKVEKTEQKFLDAIIPSSGFIPTSLQIPFPPSVIMSNIAGLHSTSFPAVPATTGTSLTEAHTKQLHESYLRALQQTCEEEGRALKKLTTPSLVTDGQQRVGSLAVNASPSVRQISIHDQSKQSHATEIPDLLSGFENIAKNSVSSSSTDCALALRAHGQSFAMNPASDLDHERKTSVMTSTLPGSPPFTSRSFDDFHRFLGKDLTLDSDVTGSEINTSISSVSHVVLDTSALFAAESYAMFARESALEANRLVSDFVPLSDAPLSTKVGSQTQITCEVDSMLKQVCEHTFGSPAIVISKRPLIDDSKLHVHHHAKSVVSVDISGKELVQQSMLQASQVTSSVPKAAFIVERFMGASNLVSGSEPSGSSSSNSNGNHEESSSMDTAGTADCSEDEDSNISDSSSGSDVAPHRNKKSKLDESNGGTPISARRVQFEKRL